jgi:putative intracellular protease/amidase
MKKIILGPLILVIGFISFVSPSFAGGTAEAFGQGKPKVLLILREGFSQDVDLMIKKEVGVMTHLLRTAGFEVDMATTSGLPIVGPTQKLDRLMRLIDVDLNNYKGIILAGMAVGNFPGPPVSVEAIVLIRKALSEGKPVAANADSGTILAAAAILCGKKYSFVVDPINPPEGVPEKDVRFEGGIYSGRGVVVDGNVITSGVCPYMEREYGWKDQTGLLTQALIDTLRSK